MATVPLNVHQRRRGEHLKTEFFWWLWFFLKFSLSRFPFHPATRRITFWNEVFEPRTMKWILCSRATQFWSVSECYNSLLACSIQWIDGQIDFFSRRPRERERARRWKCTVSWFNLLETICSRSVNYQWFVGKVAVDGKLFCFGPGPPICWPNVITIEMLHIDAHLASENMKMDYVSTLQWKKNLKITKVSNLSGDSLSNILPFGKQNILHPKKNKCISST